MSCWEVKFHSLQFQYSTPPMNAPLGNNDGGIRPITVGNTIRRLSVIVAWRTVVRDLGEKLRPVTLGSQPVGDARRLCMRPDIMSGIVATEGSFWRSTWRVFLKIDLISISINCLISISINRLFEPTYWMYEPLMSIQTMLPKHYVKLLCVWK